MLRQSKDFAKWGLNSSDDVANFIKNIVNTKNPIIVSQSEKVYNTIINGAVKQIKIITGSNGYIVTAHPFSH